MRIIFAGTPDFSSAILEAMINANHQIVAVYTQPDRRAGRGKKLLPPPVKVIAEQANIPVFQPLSLKDETAQIELASHNADIMVVVAYGLLLPQSVLDIPPLGCINIHASLLPRWRGAAPVERSIEAGDSETGITMMRMDAGLDTGDMILVERCPIPVGMTGDELRNTLLPLAIDATFKTLQSIQDGSVKYIAQNEVGANYASKLQKTEGFLHWHEPAEQMARRIGAFNSSNVCYAILENGERVKVWRARAVVIDKDNAPGTIIDASDNSIVVACKENALAIEQLQLSGGKMLGCRDILNSRRDWFMPGNCFLTELTS